jgi:hypothetical protein
VAEDGDLDKRDFTSGSGLGLDGLGPCRTLLQIIKNINLLNDCFEMCTVLERGRAIPL